MFSSVATDFGSWTNIYITTIINILSKQRGGIILAAMSIMPGHQLLLLRKASVNQAGLTDRKTVTQPICF